MFTIAATFVFLTDTWYDLLLVQSIHHNIQSDVRSEILSAHLGCNKLA